jgi:uncharacterized protein YdcH (DUF465 family)
VVKAKIILVLYLMEDKMKIKSKTYKRLKEQHDYLKRKVKELTEDRKKDRSSESKTLLVRLKKSKLALKDALARAKAVLTKQ